MASSTHAPEQVARDHVFLALLPPWEVRMQAIRLQQELASRCGIHEGLMGIERLHMTLWSLGMFKGVPETLLPVIDQVARAVDAAPFDVVLDSLGGWPQGGAALFSRRPAFRSAVCRYQRALVDALRSAGLVHPKARRFQPHMSLVYARQHVPPCGLEPIPWHVNELVLVHSLHGQSRHVVLGRWPLWSRQMRLDF